MTRQQILWELDRELGMRKKVWQAKRKPTGEYFFTDLKKQNCYDRLEKAAQIFEKMTDEEFEQINSRTAGTGNNQPELF